VAGLFTNGVLF